MAVLGWGAVSYERGTPVGVPPRGVLTADSQVLEDNLHRRGRRAVLKDTSISQPFRALELFWLRPVRHFAREVSRGRAGRAAGRDGDYCHGNDTGTSAVTHRLSLRPFSRPIPRALWSRRMGTFAHVCNRGRVPSYGCTREE